MPREIEPRYYAIDNWKQITNATSNTDPTLKIRYTQFLNSHLLEGGRIQVVHPEYGILFSCLVEASGSIVDYDPNAFLSTPSILLALRQLGFDIRFKINPEINSSTRDYLKAAKEMGYTTVRWCLKKYRVKTDQRVWDGNKLTANWVEKKTRTVILFDSNKRPDFLNQFIPPISNFGGDILEVDLKKYPELDFSWLILPMNIQDILDKG